MNDKTYGCAMPCKECNRERCRGYKRSESLRARDRVRRQQLAVREESRERSSTWYQAGRGREWMREYSAARYAAHSVDILAANNARYHAKPALREALAVAQRARRATHEGRAAHNASNAKYKSSDRGRLLSRMHAQLRRARILSTVCDLTDEQWLALVEAHESRCAYCQRQAPMTIDHVVALSLGGEHTLSNVVPACNRCNVRKSARTLERALAVLGVARDVFEQRCAAALVRMGGAAA